MLRALRPLYGALTGLIIYHINSYNHVIKNDYIYNKSFFFYSRYPKDQASKVIIKSHHHHHVVPPARISLTLSRHFALSFIVLGRSSGLHPVSSHSCSMYVRAGRPAFAWSYAGVYRSTSLMSSSLLFQQCPACLVCLTCIVFMMGGKWPYSWCLVGCGKSWRQHPTSIKSNQYYSWQSGRRSN